MTKTRTAACGSRAQMSMSRGLRSSAGDVLDPFHQLDQLFPVGGLAGGEPDAAIAHDRGGDAVPGRGRQMVVPYRLRIVVGVDVDEAGRDQLALGVDFLGAAFCDLADHSDAVAGDADIGFDGRTAGAIDDGAAADDQVEFGHWTLLGACLHGSCGSFRSGASCARRDRRTAMEVYDPLKAPVPEAWLALAATGRVMLVRTRLTVPVCQAPPGLASAY
jgi:hypothetical protein